MEMAIKEETLSYYRKNAENFVKGTINADMEFNRKKFLQRLPDHGKILDFGCGSGRDAKVFLNLGYEVEAADGCRELCEMAAEYTGIVVRQMDFMELDVREKYDGIWACASVLHLPYEEIKAVMEKMAEALKENGVFYVSFKYGEFEGWRNGRYFTDMTEDGVRRLVEETQGMSAEEIWVTADVREGRGDERWVNGVGRKNGNEKIND
jgi:SAM-dependent methyltransferase